MADSKETLRRAREKILGRLAPLKKSPVPNPKEEFIASFFDGEQNPRDRFLADFYREPEPPATPSRAEVLTQQQQPTPTTTAPPPAPGSHLDEGEFPVWFERGRPETEFVSGAGAQPAVNPYTGQPLKETPIFGGLGTISEAFATPSDASIRFQNPYADSNLSPMQQKMAAAEIGAIQDSITRTKSKSVWDIVRKNGRKVKEINSDPTVPQSVKDQINQQYSQDIENAGKYADPEHLLETYEAQADPSVTLAKQKEAMEFVMTKHFNNPELAHLIASMGEIDAKTGKPSFAAAMPLITMWEKERADEQREMREHRKTKAGALAQLRDAAEKAASEMNPVHIESYLSLRSKYEEDYAPLSDTKPVYGEGEFDLAAELKSITAAGKVNRAVRNQQGYVEVTNEADLEALQDEADRTGISIDCVYNGVVGKMHPQGGNF